jgi:succinate dehydrogenase/fumarate reductase flavoprotein subunit
MTADVVVVGSGGAALVSALHAATRGAKVTVLERAPVFGGTSALFGGRLWVPLHSLGRKESVCYRTECGPAIDANAQLLGSDDRPITGLFAAGNTTAGIFGHAYPGRGGTLGAATVMGWIAGRSLTSCDA